MKAKSWTIETLGAHDAADRCGPQQAAVSREELIKFFICSGREWPTAPTGDVDIHHHDLDCGCQLLTAVVDEEADEIGALRT